MTEINQVLTSKWVKLKKKIAFFRIFKRVIKQTAGRASLTRLCLESSRRNLSAKEILALPSCSERNMIYKRK